MAFGYLDQMAFWLFGDLTILDLVVWLFHF
jgi:hypothetical protein